VVNFEKADDKKERNSFGSLVLIFKDMPPWGLVSFRLGCGGGNLNSVK
jgi:hypothetical protein